MSIPTVDLTEEQEIRLSAEAADLIVDAIYGTGFHGELRDPVRRVARLINRFESGGLCP